MTPEVVALAVTAGGAYGMYALAAKRLLAAGHAPESVMAAAFGLGALADEGAFRRHPGYSNKPCVFSMLSNCCATHAYLTGSAWEYVRFLFA